MALQTGRGRTLILAQQPLSRLTEADRSFRAGLCFRRSAAQLAGLVFNGLSGVLPGVRGVLPGVSGLLPEEEQSCISLGLVGRLCSCLTAQSFTAEEVQYCQEVLKVLFEHLDIMPQLVLLFQCEDQIISHLSAKSVSACVLYCFHTSGSISPVWVQMCLRAFQSSPPGTKLDACLWSLTDVLTKLLKGAHQETFVNLLTELGSGLSSLCTRFLPADREELMQSFEGNSSSRQWGATFCLLLDLLEVLTASSLTWGPATCLSSQRITHLHSCALLKTISISSDYFVKKRVVLLLKTAVLQRAGEDWTSGAMLLYRIKHEHFTSDMKTLALSVLTAVAAGWLQTFEVESDSFFGGTRTIKGNEVKKKPDCVMLRAVSLLLLKSADIHIQTSGGSGARSSDVSGCLQCLWIFLRNSGVLLSAHRCCWVSQLFSEQDDDMMEAAKASLDIFLHHRRCTESDLPDLLDSACESGNNPHCIFLCLLQSVSFDHSVLLDFLISIETCFLEFLVRYLKFLTADWEGFSAACGKIGVLDSRHSQQQTSFTGGAFTLTGEREPHVPLLVQYGSSNESDPEDMDMESSPAASHQQEGTGVNVTAVSCGTVGRGILCLLRLREVVTRLQEKKLFPYNPSSLLKLLARVEKVSPVRLNKS